MANHPIEGLMNSTMESLKEMVDVNTIVGDPVETHDGLVIIPISKISLGFASGGSEFKGNENVKGNAENSSSELPFGGGSGAGISVQPVAFIVVGNGQMKLLPVDQGTNMLNNIMEMIPNISNVLQNKFKSKKDTKLDDKNLSDDM
ncbi:GerW family sporulation protein [Clostridium sp. D2Q-14]|uniref:GerW family sporulation protein n=1 Tax=Anaeromonas gelatinilytica TaxID=2683194 RepID=UPI00193BA567|nr:GerW family sporulation protein [Anaeromonas gelatinilytica]MBS4536237.1 GerW family sporulation protein [Anaeromonas gelatinilytica]